MKHRLHVGSTSLAAGAVALALLVALVLPGCGRSAVPGEAGAIALRLLEADPRTLLPEGDFAPASYLVAGSGPEGESFSVEITTASTTVQELAVGEWTVTATARNAAGSPVAYGQGTVEVAGGQTADLALSLTAIAGTGSIELTISWDASLAVAPAPTAELVASSGVVTALPVVIGGSASASCSSSGIAAGWYTLVVRLYDGATLVAGAADAALIRAEAVTRGTVVFQAPPEPATGSVTVTITMASPRAIEMAMAGQLDVVLPLQSLVLETAGAEGASLTWYLDGTAVGTADLLSLASPAAIGRHRIDAVALDAAGLEAGSVSHDLIVAARAPAGTLTDNYALVDGQGGISGLNGARAVVVSADGATAYVTGYEADAVAIFSRSVDTGLLRYVGRTQSGADGLDGADGLCLSPGGGHLYVAGYTDDAVAGFACTPGALTAVGVVSGLEGARDVAVSPDGAFVYAALAGSSALAVLARDATTGALTLASTVANGSGGVTLMDTPTEVAVSSDGAQVYVTAYGSDALLWFSRDATTGALTPAGVRQDGVDGVDGLNGAHGLALSPDGSAVLVAAYLDGSVSVFSREPATGGLAFVSIAADGASGVTGLDGARDVVIAPGGDMVFASGSGADSVVALGLDLDTLALSYLQTLAVGDLPRGLGLSPDGRSLYVCSSGADTLTAMRISP